MISHFCHHHWTAVELFSAIQDCLSHYSCSHCAAHHMNHLTSESCKQKKTHNIIMSCSNIHYTIMAVTINSYSRLTDRQIPVFLYFNAELDVGSDKTAEVSTVKGSCLISLNGLCSVCLAIKDWGLQMTIKAVFQLYKQHTCYWDEKYVCLYRCVHICGIDNSN